MWENILFTKEDMVYDRKRDAAVDIAEHEDTRSDSGGGLCIVRF